MEVTCYVCMGACGFMSEDEAGEKVWYDCYTCSGTGVITISIEDDTHEE